MKVSVVGGALWAGWFFLQLSKDPSQKAPCCPGTSFPGHSAGENIPAASFEVLQGNDRENSSALCSWNCRCSLFHGPFNLLRRRKGRGDSVLGRPPAPGRGPSHPCPPSTLSQPSWGQPGQGQPGGNRAEGVPWGPVWSGMDQQRRQWLETGFAEDWKILGWVQVTHQSLTLFQGTKTPHFNNNLTLLDVITTFVQVSAQLSCTPAGGQCPGPG